MRRKQRQQELEFDGKKHSRPGIISSVLGGIALLADVIVLVMAYMQSGQAGKIVGVTGFLAMWVSLVGLYYGIRGLREQETKRLFPRLGFVLNLLLLAGFGAIYALGM
ncbi:MAG: DUF6142 family protein [Lachnospiraceae bacterium]|nr:DUF6142 family protein [Lachnospiraceae bacterium]